MSTPTRRLIVWLPRVMAVATIAFFALFALDAFNGQPLAQALPDFVMHLLPAAVLAAATWLAWRHPWVGVLAFGGAAVAYALSVRRIDWVLAISGPLAVTALLFAIRALVARRPAARA